MRESTFSFFCSIMVGLVGLAGSSSLHAQSDFPNRPISIVVPYGAGGGADFVARTISQKMSEKLGQTIIVENKPGGGSTIAALDVARAAPDGHRILLGDLSTFSTNPNLFKNLRYDPIKDFTPISLVSRTPYIMVVNPKVHPFKTVEEYVAAVREAPPGTVTYGSAGVGGPAHLTALMFEEAADVHMLHVPFRGSAPAIPSLIGGDVGMLFTVYSSVKSLLETDRLRALGTGAAKAQPELPNVPAIGASYPGFESWFWMGLVAPKDTPAPIVDKLRAAYAAAVSDPEIRQKMIGSGVEPLTTTSAEMGEYIRAEAERWGKIIKDAQISLD